jgi:hypothetical protein
MSGADRAGRIRVGITPPRQSALVAKCVHGVKRFRPARSGPRHVNWEAFWQSMFFE